MIQEIMPIFTLPITFCLKKPYHQTHDGACSILSHLPLPLTAERYRVNHDKHASSHNYYSQISAVYPFPSVWILLYENQPNSSRCHL